ncbi:DUF1294 domain-containing protein [Asticcacaulis sp. DW145]|jgi:uncharacterized membrane protein YsdA (DUF1294 family)|uniref:DUF1294 domain-containing protein n=1 Tax=Asticcacaulis currens TaxID=2984210 RepID=A0ABT5IF00_9CAUL|nr:DUF1294 domain-containing protein [Asticcacaulis currens]MDC7694770.1 DUF1294 domain-containing protein [Asticcacaulis currens]BEV11193.1 DUF1294 domain-containing protein [Asticcacaulis sp. DW145]
MTLWILALGGLALINLVTFQVWAADKRRAIRRERRVPEATLLRLCWLGGWPAALLSMRLFRHKSVKRDFKRRFNRIVWLHLLAMAATIIAFQTL